MQAKGTKIFKPTFDYLYELPPYASNFTWAFGNPITTPFDIDNNYNSYYGTNAGGRTGHVVILNEYEFPYLFGGYSNTPDSSMK